MRRTPRNAIIVIVVVTAFVLVIFLSPEVRSVADQVSESLRWLRRVGVPLLVVGALALIGLIYGLFLVAGLILRSRIQREHLRRGPLPRDRRRLLGGKEAQEHDSTGSPIVPP